ncbi:MAG: hypothetical protein DU489_12585 [Nitrosomonas sp.]|uniref:hypothetical protein n=1 Tax=Nitrosomonas sp. TaxID=42353 RepID=UPI0032EF5A00
MDPIMIIVTALAAGAAAGLKPTAEQAIKDAYVGLKTLIQHKYKILSVEALEQKPDSETKQASIVEDLTDAGAANDMELLDQAKSLIDVVKAHDLAAAARININFEDIEASYLKLKDAAAEGDVNITIKKTTISGGIYLEGLTAGTPGKK